MKPDLQRVFEIFREVVELDPGARTEALGKLCGADRDTYERVERMLHEDSREEVPLDRPLGSPLAALTHDEAGLPQLTRIAGYTIEGVLDAGGMGTVYAATQANPNRPVALKTIRAGLAGESMLKRFRLEAEVLGSLEHPGIARVYESGIHAEGSQRIPFIAMELVAGAKDIVRYARESGLDRRGRIQLFLRVCEAVQYGHQRGVIHRDLKPNNLLVDENGAVKVIDFGLARVLDPEGYALSMAETGSGQMIGTLQYMSPEQLEDSTAGADIRFDVYSLGVVLFELLADRFPYDIEGLNLAGAARVIAEQEPLRLGRVRPELAGDLDWIVGRALERERERRYSSLSELAADLRRHLRNEPVSVGPPSGWYRLRKFAGRNRWQVAAAVGLMLAIAGGAAGTLWQNVQARKNLEARNLHLEISEEAYGFLQRVFRSVRPDVAMGVEVTAREILDQARRELAAVPPSSAAVEAEVRRNLGETYGSLGEYDIAMEELTRSLELHRDHYGPGDFRTTGTEISLLFDRIEFGESEEVEKRARTLLDSLEADPEADPEMVIEAKILLGSALRASTRLEEADGVFLDATDHAESALGPEAELTWMCRQARTTVLADASRFAEAYSLKQRIYEHRSEMYDELDPIVLNDGLEVAGMLANLGRIDEAETLWSELLPRLEKVRGEDHPLCLSHGAFRGWCLARAGSWADSSKQLGIVLQALREARGNEVAQHMQAILDTAEGLQELGRLDDALEVYFAGMEAQQRLAEGPSLTKFRLMEGTATVLLRRGELADAETLYLETLQGSSELLGDHWLPTKIRTNLGGLYYTMRRFEEARPLIESAVAFHELSVGPDNPYLTLLVRNNHGTLLRELGELDRAEEVLMDVFERRQRVLPADHNDLRISRVEILTLAAAFEGEGRQDRADALRKALTVQE